MRNINYNSFSEILRQAIEKQKFILVEDEEVVDDTGELFTETCLIEREARDISYKILESFEVFGDFLNPIFYQEKEKIIYNQLMPWINRYSTNRVIDRLNNMYPIDKEAGKEIKKNIGIIEKFELMLLDSFVPVDKGLDINHMIELEKNSEKTKTLKKIKTLLNSTEALKNDLKNKDFKIFPKHKYYKYSAEPKRELNKILTEAINKYNLKSHSPRKKQLIDFI